MPLLRKEDQEKFLKVLHEDLMNVNLFEVAKKCGFDFFNDIQVTIDYDASFYEKIQQFLISVKYNLVQRVIDENDNKSVTCARAVIEFIESGTLLKRTAQEKKTTPVQEAHPSLRKALGLDQPVNRLKATHYKPTDKATLGLELPMAIRRPKKPRGRPKGKIGKNTTRVDLIVPGEGDLTAPDTEDFASNLSENEKEDLDNEPF